MADNQQQNDTELDAAIRRSEAARRKRLEAAYRANTQAARDIGEDWQDYDNSVANDWFGLDQGGTAANAVNIAAKGASAFSRMAGEGLNFGDSIEDSWEEQTDFSQDQLDAYNRLKAERHRRERLAELDGVEGDADADMERVALQTAGNRMKKGDLDKLNKGAKKGERKGVDDFDLSGGGAQSNSLWQEAWERTGPGFIYESAKSLIPDQPKAAAERMADLERRREERAEIEDTFDLSSMVYEGNTNRAMNNLTDSVADEVDGLQAGWAKLTDGETKEGILDLASAVAGIGTESLNLALDDPQAVAEFFADSAPGIMMAGAGKIPNAMQGLGYGMSIYRDGVNRMREEEGRMPTESEAQTMAMKAVAIGLLDSVGDANVGRALRGGRAGALTRGDTARKAVLKRQQGELKSAKKAAKKAERPTMGDPAVQDAQKRIRTTANRLRSSARAQQKGVVASTAGAAGSLGKTMAVEGGTEGIQTKLEGDVTGQEASLNDMVKAAVVGGAVGGAARASNFNPGPAIAKSLSGRATAKNQKTADTLNDGLVESELGSIEEQTRKAEQSGEVGDLLNPETTAYSPESAAASMAKRLNNTEANLTAEQRDAARKTLDDAASRAEESWQQLAWKQQITQEGGVREVNEALKGARADLKEAEAGIKKAGDAKAKKIAKVRAAIARKEVTDLEADLEVAKRGLSAEEQKSLAEQVSVAKKRAQGALSHKKSVTDNEAKTNPDTLIQSLSRPATETGNDTASTSRDGNNLIRLAMSDPASLSASAIERLVNDVENSLTDPQRESLRRFTKAQATEHAKKKTQRVRNDIINGSGGGKGDKAYRGMAQYRETVANGLASGNTRLVNNQLSLLRNFRTSHTSKASALQEAMNQVRGTNESRTVQRTEDGLEWEVSTDRVSKSQRGTEGSLVVKDSPQSQSLVTRVGNEAEYIDNTYGQLRNAADSHFADDTYVRTDVSTQEDVAETETDTESQTAEPVTEEVTEQVEEAAQATEQTQEANDTTETENVSQDATETVTEEAPETEQRTEEDDGELFDLDSIVPETTTETQATREADTNAEIDALLNNVAETETTTTEETQGEVDQAVQELEQTQEEQAENSESVSRYTGEAGYLAALAPRGPKVTPENILSGEVNLASQMFRQVETTTRPFVAAKNFARQAYHDPSVFQQFVKEKLSADQKAFLQNVMGEAALLGKLIKNRAPESLSANPAYQHQDLFKSLLGKNNAIEENLLHAIATSGLAWITESDINMAYNTKDDVNRLMHRDKDAGVSRDLMDMLGSVGVRRNTVIEQIGQRASRLLGLKPVKDAYGNLDKNMAMSLGARAVQALEDAGYVQTTEINTHDLLNAAEEPIPEGLSAKSTSAFIRITTKGSAGRDKVNGLVSAARASDNVLQRLLSDEANSTRPPSPRQIKFTQVKVKNGTTNVPRSLKSIMGQKTKEANYVREEKLALVEAMDAVDPDALAEVGGASPQGFVYQANLRESGENRDRDIRRGLQSFKDYVAGAKNLPNGIKTPVFLDQEVWSVQRVGVKSSLINPQGNTHHRFMMKMPSWDTEVSTSRDGAMHGDYLLGVAEAFGVKTEKAERDDNIAAALETLADPVIDAGVEAVRKQIRGEELTIEDTRAIVAAAQEGKEKYHSLDGLHAAAAMAEAQANGEETVTLTLPREVDGKTNGPMMALMQLGMDKARMTEMMARGGFYTQASGEQGYHTWGAKEGSADIYEAVATTLRDTITEHLDATVQESNTPEATRQDMTIGLQHVATFTGPMVDKTTGKVKGRNFVKTPITAMSFGSSLNTVVKNMSNEFVDNALEKIQKLYNDPQKTSQAKEEEFQRLFTALNGLTPLKTSKGKINRRAVMKPMTLEQFMAQGITEDTDKAIRRNFSDLMGEPIKSAMKRHFSEFLDRKTFIDSGAEAAFGLFSSLYDFEVQRFRKELADKGELPTTSKGNPVMDLTTEQHDALMERLKDVTPLVHTAWSLKDGDLSAGLMMAKNGRADMTGDLAYRTRAAFTRVDGGTGNKTWDLYPTVRRYEAPGARTLPTLTHAQDSYTASSSYAKVPSLNVHDALVTGLRQLGEAAHDLNKNMFESMVDYSLPREVANAVERTVEGFSRYVNQHFPDGLPPELADRIGGALGSAQERFERSRGEELTGDQDILSAIVTGLRDMAVTAEKDKLTFLADLAVVSQYPSEGGNYEVDDAGRARAKERLEELNTQSGAIVTGEQTKALFENIANVRAGLAQKPVTETEPSTPAGEDTEVREETETEPKAKGPSRVEEAGTRGTGNVVERTPLSDAIAGDKIKTGAQLADLAMQSLGNRATDKGMALILGRVRKMIPKDLKVSIVTPDNVTTRINEDGFHPEASAMFMSSGKVGDAGTIYIKGEGFAEASPTAEMAVHELIHAVTARKIQAARKRLSRDKKAKSKVITAVRDLEGLRREMVDHLKANNPKALQKHGPALISVDEMVSWGLTNADFQQLLRNFKTQGSAATKQGLLMTGMKRLLDQVRTVFFGEKAATRGETSAFDSVLSNSMVLLQENRQARDDVDKVKLYQEQATRNMTTTQVFDMLGSAADGNRAFNDHLRDLVYHIEDKLQGPLGAFRQQAKKTEAATPVETFIKSVQTGQVPFVSDAIASGFPLTDRQSLVLEQVELAMREAASSHHATYRELAKVFSEARSRLTDADFHNGDWASATPTEKAKAKAKRDYLFKLKGNDKNGRSNHLARFVAMAMAQPDVNNLLRFQTDSVERLNGNNSLSDRIANAVERAMQFIAGRLTKGYAGQRADERIQALMSNLVDSEARHRENRKRSEDSRASQAEELVGDAWRQVFQKITGLASGERLSNMQHGATRLAGELVNTVSTDRVEEFMDGVRGVLNLSREQRQGMIASALSEMVGSLNEGRARAEQQLRRVAVVNEQARRRLKEATQTNVESLFQDYARIPQEDRDTLTKVAIRTDMSALLDDYGLDGLESLVSSNEELDTEIERYRSQVKRLAPKSSGVLRQANDLGYLMIHGIARNAVQAMNADAIVQQHLGDVEQHPQTVDAVDKLASLYALRYSGGRDTMARIMREQAQRGSDNALQHILKMHQQLQRHSQKSNTAADRWNQIKGETAEITDPHMSVMEVDQKDVEKMEKRGFKKLADTPMSPEDSERGPRVLMAVRDGGRERVVTGNISYTGTGIQGTTLEEGYASDATLAQKAAYNRKLEWAGRYVKDGVESLVDYPTGHSPETSKENHRIPTLDQSFQPVSFRLSMPAEVSDVAMRRDNDLSHVLGTYASRAADKEQSLDQNRQAIDLMASEYEAASEEQRKNFIEVSEKAQDKGLRESFNMLPPDAKAYAKEKFGNQPIMVRKDLADVMFGYRKASLVNMLHKSKDERNAAEALMADFLGSVLGDKAAMRVRRAEDMWQAVVTEAKDALVIKNLATLVGNAVSNLSVLYLNRVPMKQALRDHREAFSGLREYRQMQAEWDRLTQLDGLGLEYSEGRQVSQRLKELDDAMNRNPVKRLIDEGLLPTIVEDVDQMDDRFSYKNELATRASRWTAKMPPMMRSAGRTLYMTHDTPLYKAFNQGTQMSDFLARYTLYNHMTTRRKNPVGHDEAIQRASDMFVNYDVPTSRGLQYLNDVGAVMFTKYFLRIQRSLFQIFREQPARTLSLMAAESMLGNAPTVMDSTLLNKLTGGGPIMADGALGWFQSLDDIFTINMALRPFN